MKILLSLLIIKTLLMIIYNIKKETVRNYTKIITEYTKHLKIDNSMQ